MWYDTTYVVPAVTATGDEKLTACQPDTVSFVNVAEASCVPVDDHNVPVCGPVFALDL